MQNKVIDQKFTGIIDSVCYWLGYQFKIGREQLIHEASLRYPIADSITSNGIAINRIVLEKLHPIFKSKKIDLVIFDDSVKHPENETDDSRLIEVYEFKIAKNKTGVIYSDEHQRVFDDVVRLAFYNHWHKKDCYFLMCGTYENFKTYFVGQKNEIKKQGLKNIISERQNKKVDNPILHETEEWLPAGLYEDWFSFRIGEPKTKTFKIESETWGLIPFKKNYFTRDNKYNFTDELTIKTTCMALSPIGEKNKTHAAGIWKIEAL